MTLLHFRRTFVEKLFAIHGKVERLKRDDHPLGRDVRHYADLHVLAGRPEVTEMLASPEYEQIRTDYDEKGRKYFARSYSPPDDLHFGSSDALFPSEELRATIEPPIQGRVHPPVLRAAPDFPSRAGADGEHSSPALMGGTLAKRLSDIDRAGPRWLSDYTRKELLKLLNGIALR